MCVSMTDVIITRLAAALCLSPQLIWIEPSLFMLGMSFIIKQKLLEELNRLSRPHLFCGGWGDKFIDIFSQVPPAAYFGVASDSSIFSLKCLLEICNVEMQAFKECHLEEVSYFKICKYESFIKGTLLFLVAITSTRSLFSLCFVKSFDGSIAN